MNIITKGNKRTSDMMLKIASILFAVTMPMIAFASSPAAAILDGDTLFERVVDEILSPLYQLMVGISIIYFLYGVAKFIYDMNDPQKKTFGKSHLLYGLIGMFIILSVGGILPWLNGIVNGMFQY